MAWDFATEPEFQEKLDWIDEFVRDEIEPLDLAFNSHLRRTTVAPGAREGHPPAQGAGEGSRASGPATSAPSSAASATAS